MNSTLCRKLGYLEQGLVPASVIPGSPRSGQFPQPCFVCSIVSTFHMTLKAQLIEQGRQMICITRLDQIQGTLNSFWQAGSSLHQRASMCVASAKEAICWNPFNCSPHSPFGFLRHFMIPARMAPDTKLVIDSSQNSAPWPSWRCLSCRQLSF